MAMGRSACRARSPKIGGAALPPSGMIFDGLGRAPQASGPTGGAMKRVRSALACAALLCATAHITACGSSDMAQTGGSAGTGANVGPDGSSDSSLGGGAGTDGGANGGGGSSNGGSGGSNAGGDAGACRLVGATCTVKSDCCTASCDTNAGLCANAISECRAAGSSCILPQDCCTLVCSNGTCGAKLCTSDNQPCTASDECCGGNCGASADGGARRCVPLNTSCRTAGNQCSTDGQCCSHVCRNGVCEGAVSFCAQNGDVCASNFECCGGLCTKAQGATLGVCGVPSAPGATGCTVAGQLCSGSGDSGVTDAGVPSCGGDCCSRACAPYRTGVLVCQPPSGCHPTGEICRTDADCCGYGGVQGVTGVGNCSKANASDPVGRCDNGNACRPAGAICKLATTSCNAENNCCSGNVNQNPFVCQQDVLGIPRCTMAGTSCADAGSKAGQACATGADCCGLPCVPNPSFMPNDAGVPPFICGGICVGFGGACSTTADCCPGLPCVAAPGSARGTCGDRPSIDAGVPDGSTGTNDGSTAPD